MTTHMTQQQLESYLWGSAVILRGLVDAGDYKQFVFPLIFFKRLSDVWDEDSATALAESKGDEGAALADEIDAQFAALEAALAGYGSLDAGFVDYATLTDADKKALSDEVNALAEPLSQLTATVLGV